MVVTGYDGADIALLENNSWAPGGWGWGLAINGVQIDALQIEKLSLMLSLLLTFNQCSADISRD